MSDQRLNESFQEHVQKAGYWSPLDKAVIAVSGGVDSMVLAHLMVHLPEEIKPKLIFAHVNHKLREASDKEEETLKDWAACHQVKLVVHRWDKSEHPEKGMEEAARDMRYQFFEQVMLKEQANLLLTAHHANDQAETILMKLTRGGLLEQFTGMKENRLIKLGKLLRPLLPFSKQELYRYAKEQKLPYSEDETNAQLMYARNRYRNQILPLLKEENEKVEDHLISFADDLANLLSFAGPLIEEKLKEHVKETEKGVQLDRATFSKEPLFTQRLLLSELFKRLGKQSNRPFKKKQIDIVIEWIETSGPNSFLHLTDHWVVKKEYNTVHFLYERQASKPQWNKDFETSLSLDEWTTLPSGERIGLVPFDEEQAEESQFILLLDEQVAMPLTIRHRKNGDRMELKGSGGTKKLKDIFIDQKVPLDKRDAAWVVEDANNRIIWVVGYKESVLSSDKITDRIIYMLVIK